MEGKMKIRIKFGKIVTSISIVILFISLGMYDSENIVLPLLMTLISLLLIIVFAE
jgi:hypothetical protein